MKIGVILADISNTLSNNMILRSISVNNLKLTLILRLRSVTELNLKPITLRSFRKTIAPLRLIF